MSLSRIFELLEEKPISCKETNVTANVEALKNLSIVSILRAMDSEITTSCELFTEALKTIPKTGNYFDHVKISDDNIKLYTMEPETDISTLSPKETLTTLEIKPIDRNSIDVTYTSVKTDIIDDTKQRVVYESFRSKVYY